MLRNAALDRLISAGEQMGLAELQSVVVALSSLCSRVSNVVEYAARKERSNDARGDV
jgi:hypothetical protein